MLTSEVLEKACISAIRQYLNVDGMEKFTDEYIKETYSIAIEVMKDSYTKSNMAKGGLSGVNSISQGSQSISFNTNNESNGFISDDVKALLPRPYLRLY